MGLFDIFSSKKGPAKLVCGNQWDGYHYTYETSMKALISFDVEAATPEFQKTLLFCRRVILFFDKAGVSPNGMPSAAQLSQADKLEKDLFERLSFAAFDCRIAGKMLYGGMREWVFQTSDGPAFSADIKKWLANQKGSRIEIAESDGWEFFNKKIAPDLWANNQMSDRRLLEVVMNSGANATFKHLIEYHVFGKERELRIMQWFLSRKGFYVRLNSPESATLFHLCALDGDAISAKSFQIAHYCKNNSLTYDGWETLILRQAGLVTGTWENGYGIWLFESGSIYLGNWVGSKKNGRGMMVWASGIIYEGAYLDDRIEGYGTMYFPEQNQSQIGGWASGKREGKGACFYPSGSVEYGPWLNDVFLKEKIAESGGFFWKVAPIANSGLKEKIAAYTTEAKSFNLKPLLFVSATWAPPAMALIAALYEREIQEIFSGYYVIELDDSSRTPWGNQFDEIGLNISGIPAFFGLDGDGRLNGNTFSSGIWGNDVPSVMAAPLKANLALL